QTSGPLRHHLLETRGRSRTAWRRAARAMVRSTRMARSWFGLTGPVCAIARRPPAPEASHALQSLVRDRWESVGLGPTPKTVSALLLTGGLRTESKVVALLFPGSSARPAVAVKIPRTQASEPSIRHEAKVLRGLIDRVDGGLTGVPRFLFLDEL